MKAKKIIIEIVIVAVLLSATVIPNCVFDFFGYAVNTATVWFPLFRAAFSTIAWFVFLYYIVYRLMKFMEKMYE